MQKVNISGIDTGSLPTLKNSENREMLKRIKNGEEHLKDEFVMANIRLVLSVIQKFANRCENMDDLFQVGCIGLLKAIDNFDFKFDVKFSTYAVPMIMGEMRRYLRDDHSLRVSRSMRDIAYKALQVKGELINKLDREPTIEEIAKELECESVDVAMALESIVDPVSLFEPVYNEGGDNLFIMDQISDKNAENEKWATSIAIKNGLAKLKERERQILYLRFFKGRTQVEVADEIGISQAQVSRLEKTALKNMRRHVE